MTDICPECGSSRIIHNIDRAEAVCGDCGLVVTEQIYDTGPDWRTFENDQESRARGGPPQTFTIHDKGLSTTIDWRNRDVQGRDITPLSRSQIYRMRKWQKRISISDAASRNLAFAMSELNRLTSHLRLPKNVKETTAVLYRRAVKEKLIRGRSIESIVSACLYATCRQCKIPRTLDEIAEHCVIDKKEIGRSYRYIMRELGIKLLPTSPSEYIPRFSSVLKLSPKVQTRAMEILEEAIQLGLTSGKGPMGAAAAALYIASIQENERRTQRDVSEAAKVTEVTVRNRYKEFQERLNLEIEI